MKNLIILSLLFTTLFSSSLSFAQEASNSAPTNGNKDESWYFNFGFGIAAHPNYGTAINGQIDNLKAISTGFKRSGATVDFGFYWPLESKQVALGVSTFVVVDHMEAVNYTLDIGQTAIAFSTLWYPTSNIGDGIFLRGDFGPARFSTELKAPSGSTLASSRSDYGVALQAGIGYSLPVSSETRLALGLFFSRFKIEDESANNASLQISCML